MAELPPRTRVRDVDVMRALAHPLRMALLNYLMSVGPRTASECATAVDATASNCSWHLRQLAGWGLVARVEASDGRERPWRATPVGLEFDEFDTDPGRRAAQLAVLVANLGNDQALTQRFLDTIGDFEPAWQRASAMNTYSLRLSASELDELTAAVDALIRPYVTTIRQEPPDGSRTVHATWRAFPRVEADGTPSP